MQENEFEKQVQQKMDELKLHPSDAVWQKIELQIKKEKRRRWLLIFLPVILIGAFYGGYVLLNSDNAAPLSQQQVTTGLHENTTVPQTQTMKKIIDPIENDGTVKENKETIAQTTNTKNRSRQKLKLKSKLKITTAYDPSTLVSNDKPVANTTNEATTTIVETGKTNVVVKSPEQEKILIDKEKRTDTINPNELTKQHKDDLVTDSIAANTEKTSTVENAITPGNKNTEKNKYPWNWGFTFSAGTSGTANSLLGSVFGDGQKSMDNLNYNPNTSSGTGTTPLPGPSLIKPGIAFITGISAEKNISRKIIFTSGLNYKLFSTTNTVGSDSLSFFRARNANRAYHNYYHYIELPVGLKFQIDIFKKIPLHLNTGFSISQLISSNALQFNNTTRLYYHDNSVLNKTQVGYNAGLDIKLSSKRNRSILIGPYFNYGISKIAGTGYNKHHFTFIGLHTLYLFRKK